MRRRELIGIVGGATVRLLIVGGASAAAASRGVMLSIAADPSSRLGEFRKQMNELGYAEGRNITIEFRSAEGRIERLPALAETLVREEKADGILAESTPAAVAAHQATQTIPFVAFVGVDPVASGLAVTLARPGGNVTGVAIFADEASPKRVELVRELAPHAVRLAVAVATFEKGGKLNLTPVEETASKLGFTVEAIFVDPDHNSETLSPSILDRFDAFLCVPDVVLTSHMNEIIELLAQTHKPAVFSAHQWADNGGLISFGPDLAEASRYWASQLVRVLNGQKASDLPFERPTKFDLRINMRTARAMGIPIPPALLARAGEMIE